MAARIMLGCAILLGANAAWVTAAEPTVGQIAPDFTATNAAGEDVKLSSFRGGNIVLVFMRAHW